MTWKKYSDGMPGGFPVVNQDRLLTEYRRIPEENILAGEQRIGTEERARYSDHLTEMQVLGYLTDREAEARQKKVLAAKTNGQLMYMVCDLPPMVIGGRTEASREDIEPTESEWALTAAFLIILIVFIVSIILNIVQFIT